jgi:hypothetical protein
MATAEINAEDPSDRNPNGALGIEPPLISGEPLPPITHNPVLPPVPAPHLNVFPAKVTVGAQVWTKALLRTEGPNVEVWVETAQYPHEPELVFQDKLAEVESNTLSHRYPLARQQAEIRTENTNLTVQKQGGCGCGSKLRSLGNSSSNATVNEFEAVIRSHFPQAQF